MGSSGGDKDFTGTPKEVIVRIGFIVTLIINTRSTK